MARIFSRLALLMLAMIWNQVDCAPSLEVVDNEVAEAEIFIFQNHMYVFSTGPKSTLSCMDAEQMCIARDEGHMVQVNSMDEQKFIRDTIQQKGWTASSYYLGLQSSNGGAYEWISDSKTQVLEDLWAEGNPMSASDGGCSCAAMNLMEESTGKWLSKSCSNTFNYICESDSYITIGTHLYTIFDGYKENNLELIKDHVFYCYGARDYCVIHGHGTLVNIKSAEEQTQVAQLLADKQVKHSYFWIGAFQAGSPTLGYKYADDTPLNYSNWKINEPVDQGCACGMIAAQPPNKWITKSCINQQYLDAFICEYEMGTEGTVVPESPVSNGESVPESGRPASLNPTQNEPPIEKYEAEMFVHNDHLYSFSMGENGKRTFHSANHYCKTVFDGRLVNIETQEEQDYLENIMHRRGWSSWRFWIGLYREEGGGGFQWVNSVGDVPDNLWKSGYPADTTGESAATIGTPTAMKEGAASLLWENHDVEDEYQYICETGSSNFHAYKGHVYKFFNWNEPETSKMYNPSLVDDMMHCNNAARFCKDFGNGELATLKLEEEYDYISEVLDTGNLPPSAYMIGLFKRNSREYKWHSPASYAVDYTHKWKQGEPVPDRNCRCAVMETAAPHEWISTPCSSGNYSNAFICKYMYNDLSLGAPPEDPLFIDEDPTCQLKSKPNVATGGGHHYYFSDIALPCLPADEWCVRNGYGRLASITSEEEWRLLSDMIDDRFWAYRWLGLYAYATKDDKQLQYKWLDGHDVNYTYWANKQPVEFPRLTSCFCASIHPITDGYQAAPWHSPRCTNKIPFICKTDMNECCTTPCQNGGTCVNTDGGYFCSCPELYAGKHCEEYIFLEDVPSVLVDCLTLVPGAGGSADQGGLQALLWGDYYYISEGAITVSSIAEGEHISKANVFFEQWNCNHGDVCGWMPEGKDGSNAGEHITFDLGDKFLIESVATMGRCEVWLTSDECNGRYSVLFSLDGVNFENELDNNGRGHLIFQIPDLAVDVAFSQPVLARYVRFKIIALDPVGKFAIRCEVYGVLPDGCQEDYILGELRDSGNETSTVYYYYESDFLLRSSATLMVRSSGLIGFMVFVCVCMTSQLWG